MLVSSAFSSITVVMDESTELVESEGTIELGSIQQGETFELRVAAKDENTGEEWTSLSVIDSSLPKNWEKEDGLPNRKVLNSKITVPVNAEENHAYQFKAIVMNDDRAQNFFVRVFVKNNLLEITISKETVEATVNEKAVYTFNLENKSIADHNIAIKSTLPVSWIKQKQESINAKESKQIQVEVTPKIYGYREFEFIIFSRQKNEAIDVIPVKIKVNPTLKDKYSASLYGFPFYTIPLVPYHLINSFISLIFP